MTCEEILALVFIAYALIAGGLVAVFAIAIASLCSVGGAFGPHNHLVAPRPPPPPPLLAADVDLMDLPSMHIPGTITYVWRCRRPHRVPADVWRSLVYSEA